MDQLTLTYNNITYLNESVENLIRNGVPIQIIKQEQNKLIKELLSSVIQKKINATIKQYDYDNESQLVMFALNELSPYYEEATHLIEWIYNVWAIYENLKVPIDLQTRLDCENWVKQNISIP